MQRVNTSPWTQGLSLAVQLVKLSTFSPLCWATVSRTILALIHLTVPGQTVQSQLMFQPGCVTDVLLAGSVKRFSTVQAALLCVLYRETETSSESNLHASHVWFRSHSFPYFLELFLIFHAEYCDNDWRSMDEIAAVNYLGSIDWIYAQCAWSFVILITLR